MTEGARGEVDRTRTLAQLAVWRGPLTGVVCLVGRCSQQSPGREGVAEGINTLTSLSSPFWALAESNGKPEAREPTDTAPGGQPLRLRVGWERDRGRHKTLRTTRKLPTTSCSEAMVIYDRSVQLPEFLVNVGYVQEPWKTTVGHSEDTFPKKTVFRDVFPGVQVRRSGESFALLKCQQRRVRYDWVSTPNSEPLPVRVQVCSWKHTIMLLSLCACCPLCLEFLHTPSLLFTVQSLSHVQLLGTA